MIGRLLKTVGLWYVFVPHLALLRLVGPRYAILLSRALAYLHWLLTFCGWQKHTCRALARALPKIQPNVSVSATLRQYLLLQHQRFVEWHLYPTTRGRRFVAQTYQRVEGREHLDAAIGGGRGIIILAFHFGAAKMAFPALKALGYESYLLAFRGAHYANEAGASVAKVAMNAIATSEKNSGIRMIYYRPSQTFEVIAEHLRNNAMVGIFADGMKAKHFVEVPFLGGTMPFPNGLARLSARTGAPIVPVYGLHDGLFQHRLAIHPPIYCREDSPEAIRICIETYVEILEEYIRRFPWAWWTWRRLDVEKTDEGKIRYIPRALAADEGTYHTAASPVQ